jgi:hypothetical protein
MAILISSISAQAWDYEKQEDWPAAFADCGKPG